MINKNKWYKNILLGPKFHRFIARIHCGILFVLPMREGAYRLLPIVNCDFYRSIGLKMHARKYLHRYVELHVVHTAHMNR